MRRFQFHQSRWTAETYANKHKMALVGPTAFTEKCLDASNMNWFIQSADTFFPRIKKIMID